MPALIPGENHHLGWVASIVGLSIFANAVASNVRDGEGAMKHVGGTIPLQFAKVAAFLACLLSAVAPGPLQCLIFIPLFTLLSLFRNLLSERYGLFVIDGALVVGSSVSFILLSRSL